MAHPALPIPGGKRRGLWGAAGSDDEVAAGVGVEGCAVHAAVEVDVFKASLCQGGLHGMLVERHEARAAGLLLPGGLRAGAVQGDDVEVDHVLGQEVIEAHEEPLSLALAVVLRLHEALMGGHDGVEVAVLQQEQPSRAQAGGKVGQGAPQGGGVGDMGQRVAQAEEGVKGKERRWGVDPGQVFKTGGFEGRIEAHLSAIGARLGDHAGAQVAAGGLVASLRQGEGVLAGAAGGIQDGPAGRDVGLAQQVLYEGHFMRQALRPVDKAVVIGAEGVVEIYRHGIFK